MLITDILQTVNAWGPMAPPTSPIFTNWDVQLLLHVGQNGASFDVDAFAQTEDLPELPPMNTEPRLPFPCTVFEYRDNQAEVTKFSRVAVVCTQEEDQPDVTGAILQLPIPDVITHDPTNLRIPLVTSGFRIYHAAEEGNWLTEWFGTPAGRWLAEKNNLTDDEMVPQVKSLALPAFYALGMLQCANVSYEEVEQEINRQERRRRQRKKIKTARTYRIVVKVPGRKTIVVGERIAGSAKGERAFHAVRGHFSTYTEAGKLFGKYTGTFWIPAHVRGTGEPSGAKGYVVVPGQEAA